MKIKTRWVKSKDYPEHSGDVVAFARGDTIYMFRDRVPDKKREAIERHERAHVILGHTKRDTTDAFEYVVSEIDADLMAYESIQKPRRVIEDFRGVIVALEREWELTPKKALRVIKAALDSRVVPLSWMRDYERLVKEYSSKKRR